MTYKRIYRRCLEQIDKYIKEYKSLINSSKTEEFSEKLNLIYRQIKVINSELNALYGLEVSDYYYSDVTSKIYELSHLEDSEQRKIFLVKSSPNFPLSKTDDKDIIQRIVQNSRLELAAKVSNSLDLEVILKTLNRCSFKNNCELASEIVNKVSTKYSVKSKKIMICPAFKNDLNLPNELRFHYFNIVLVDGKKYIVDCSYRQFFLLANNCIDRLGIMHLTGISVGKAMFMDLKRKEVAIKILKDGYIEATEENIKAYLDGFSISFRNGLFYEETGDFSYTTPYTVEDYIHFFEGSDSQESHESRHTLGFQLRHLKNPNINFKKR